MFKVKSIYEYTSGHEDDLAFPIGQIITVTAEEDADWYAGEYVDDAGVKQEGIFPMNFVEKFEPTAPPRPTRTRTKRDTEQPGSSEAAAAASSPLSPKLPDLDPEEAVEDAKATSPTQTAAAAPAPAPAPEPARAQERTVVASAPPPAPKPVEAPAASSASAPKPAPTQSKPSGPPPVSEKPTTSSFRDRIAAFNKPAAPPVAPFKPTGSGFIKKPFVAPPPSRNAYVPPSRDVPVAKVYRRDEDPEIREREVENMETAEKAGLVPGASGEGEEGEDQPKPMSLKERLALLQKQQMEAAQRHADSAAKKEKPKRPPKKRMESQEGREDTEIAATSPLERRDTESSGRKPSLDEQHPPRPAHTHRRKSSKGPEPRDGNEADMSGAGDTTEDQGDLTEREDSDERSRHVATTAKQDDEDLDEEEENDEEDEDEDPEVRRKEELRARMARIAGGMTGMAGIFGGPMPGSSAPAPPRKKKSVAEKQASETAEDASSPGGHAPPVPMMMALPGMSRTKSPEERLQEEPSQELELDEESETETPYQENAPPSLPSRDPTGPPPIPGGRPAPPPVPTDSRPPAPSATKSLTEGSESDDELSEARNDVTQATRAPPPPPVAVPPPALPTSPRSPYQNRMSYMGEDASLASPSGAGQAAPDRRNSRPPPPVPGSAPLVPPAQTRPPPPPPPGGALSRTSTADGQPLSPTRSAVYGDEHGEDEITEYEGDYDTDIASSVPHKDALKAHQRESSVEEATPVGSPISESRPSMPPPIPSGAAPRAAPPPLPSQPPPDKRKSTDMPRGVPPPPPKEALSYDDDYDPYNYASLPGAIPAMPTISQPPPPPRASEDGYSPRRTSYQATQERRAPPAAQPPNRSHRASLDVQRSAGATSRRSVDVTRPSMESGFVANEIDLARQSGWWLQPKSLPPQLQGRKDIFFESEESTSTSSQRGGKTTVTRDIYVLYQDYSQTVITAQFDPKDSSDVRLEQRHEPPPRALRQDQLEQSYERFGRAIGEAVSGKGGSVIGDGTPQALVYELLRPHKEALLPVGTRAYGALVYSNLANASTSQNDEIRPGDIISIRNAKFQGKHGAMHAKYSMEVGKPDHVAVVAEWDGTKKKVRAWEQGRESKKVKVESFRLDDLRSGEVKIWRVMPRSWVGWEGGN